jgi:hypothetical protein
LFNQISAATQYVKPKPISCQNKTLTQQHNWKQGSSSPRTIAWRTSWDFWREKKHQVFSPAAADET